MDLRERPRGEFRRHPWEQARAEFFLRALEPVIGAGPRTVLDVGAGDGWFSGRVLRRLPGGSRVVCYDAGYTPEVLASLADRGASGPSFTSCLPSGSFDLLLALDVLEHVEDDFSFLDELVANHVGPGGTVLISVPAWPLLYGAHDATLRHFRRYKPRDAAALLSRAGLRIERAGGLFHSLLLPRLGLKLGEAFTNTRRTAAPLEWQQGTLVSRAVSLALAADNLLSRQFSSLRLDVPGLSWWALCTKPADGGSV